MENSYVFHDKLLISIGFLFISTIYTFNTLDGFSFTDSKTLNLNSHKLFNPSYTKNDGFKSRFVSPLYGTIPTENKKWKSAEEISKFTTIPPPVFNFELIKTILPHRYPFLLLDEIIEFEPGKRAVAIKQITGNENQFNGHFPNRAIMPGVLQIEALAQLGGIVCLQEPISDGKGNFFFGGVDGVKWKRPIVPGDTLVLETELLTWRPSFGIAKMTGKGYVDGELALSVKELTFALVK